MNIDWGLVLDCVLIMVKGMIGVFVVILVVWLLVALLNRFTHASEDDE